VKFVFDHSLSPSLAEIIGILEAQLDAGRTIEHLRETYPQKTKDTVWIPGLASMEPRPVVVTADPRIAKSKPERTAWLQSGLVIFFLLSFADHNAVEQAWRLVKWWPDIVKAATKAPLGKGFRVTAHGKVEDMP
jgi:hypothetical protein